MFFEKKVGDSIKCPFHKSGQEHRASAIINERNIYCFTCGHPFGNIEIIEKLNFNVDDIIDNLLELYEVDTIQELEQFTGKETEKEKIEKFKNLKFNGKNIVQFTKDFFENRIK